MVAKGSIVEALGEHKLVLPKLVNEGLAANDRVKYRFTLLQAARHHADHPTEPLHGLHAERLQAGLDDASLDSFAAETVSLGGDRYRMPGVQRLVTGAVADVGAMLSPVLVASEALPQDLRAALEQRAQALLAAASVPEDDIVTAAFLDAITHGQRERGDSLHLLVMDLHKALNGLQREIASEVVDGASVYDIEDADRELVRAFMRGVRRTSALRFDHPGLGTTATHSGTRLVLQNDIGMTDAHVLVVHVEGLECAITYTDVHLQRLVFFQSLFERWSVKWDDTRSVRDRQMEDGLYHLGIGRYAATGAGDLVAFLEFLGSRIVFLIDWNKARKRLRNLVGRSDALTLLRWAAEHDLGHMAFLRLGGDQLVFDALEFAARGQAHFGQRLEDLLGGERTLRFLQFVLRTAAEGLLQGQPESLLVDEVRAELLRHFRGSGQGLLDLVCEHAALVVELATAVRDALVELHRAGGAERALQLATSAKRWETEADRVLNQARAVGLASDDSRFFKSLIERADDIADDLEEAAFHATLLSAADVHGELLQALTALADLVVQGSHELVKALETVRVLQPGAPREDTRDFLEAIHRIAVLEHDTDTARRQVASLLVQGNADARQVLVASECAQRLEVAGDDLLHVGLMLRDFVLAGPGTR